MNEMGKDKGYRYMEYGHGRRFFLKILPGERLVDILTRFTKHEGIRHAVIVSAVGSVKNVRLSDIKSGAKLPITAARLTPHEIEGPLELLGLTGNIVPDESGEPFCHLHIIASKSSGDVVGGQMQDAEVFASCEIVLTELVIEGIARHQSKSAGTVNVFFAGEE
jgi:predicted DNA-binding protein with PD1-like motif